jgi:hypothetical protein
VRLADCEKFAFEVVGGVRVAFASVAGGGLAGRFEVRDLRHAGSGSLTSVEGCWATVLRGLQSTSAVWVMRVRS